MIAEYSPNIKWGKQSVEIVLMAWRYKAAFILEIGGNSTGFRVIEHAINTLYERLYPTEGDGPASVTLTNEAGDTMVCEDEDDLEDEWLRRMIVSAQIIEWTPPTLNEVRGMNGAEPVADGNQPWNPS